MIETIITSKTRAKILRLFLTHIDDRYYLRELERMLDESLSPLRRQLLKLTKMQILIIEEEANLKYYRLNKNFTGIEELRRLVLNKADAVAASYVTPQSTQTNISASMQPQPKTVPTRVKHDTLLLAIISFFVLATAIFVVYTSTKNIKQMAGLMVDNSIQPAEIASHKIAKSTRPDEMVSRRWKLIPGNVPVLSSGEIGGIKKTNEL